MSHTTEQPVLEPSNPQGLRIGDICSYSFGEKNRSYSIDGGCFALFFAVFRSICLSCVAVFLRSLHRFQVA